MAVNFKDPACGFCCREVVDFINNKILQNGGTPSFYLRHLGESWGDTERKLRDILTDSGISGARKNAYAWSTLALAVRFAERQRKEDKVKVVKLQKQLEEQQLLNDALVGMVNRLRDTQESERGKAQLQLQQNLTALRGVQAERDAMKNVLLTVLSTQSDKQEGPAEEDERKQTDTGMAIFGQTAASYRGASDRARRGLGQEIAAIPTTAANPGAAAAPGAAAVGREAKEGKGISEYGNNKHVAISPFSGILGVQSRASQLQPLDLSASSHSFPPTVSFPGAAAQTAAGLTLKNFRTRWAGKHSDSRKFLPGRFKGQPGLYPSASGKVRHKVRDWDCDLCHARNFQRRKQCFKCNTPRLPKGS
ncbi:hypothetical protein HJG60_012200 [Phyllostomus discolor]|uniref:RanBP2-type domain-containing protein n=1 Tax=Phyllostomus discolor TaxID=89673 RepID=A0A833ZDI5_9CHIR|nr:hypothetical protein HJG60_012200 [Phyllostomus discolor]